MKILSFTSNAYRGRLFASYLLSMPGLLEFTWNSLISNFVSENTLRKIKITGDPVNKDMWVHVHQDTIEEKYGGNLPNITGGYWPPPKERLLFTHPSADKENELLSPQDYQKQYEEKRLAGRKVLERLTKPAPP